MTRPSPYMHYPSPIFRQREDKPEPAARRLQTTCPGFPLSPYRIDYLQIHHPFSQVKSLWLLLPATSVIPGFLRFTAKRIDWHSLFPTGCQASASRGSSPAAAYRLQGRLLLRPEGPYVLMRATLRHGFLLTVSVSPPDISVRKQISPAGIPAGSS